MSKKRTATLDALDAFIEDYLHYLAAAEDALRHKDYTTAKRFLAQGENISRVIHALFEKQLAKISRRNS